jgi:glycosyltransferase involved in cell wall biosynthesis
MRILSVCIGVPGESAYWWRISNIVRILESKGHEVYFVHYCRNRSFFFVRDYLETQIKHIRLLHNEKYDLVYGNGNLGAVCSLLGKFFTRIPLIFDMHGGLVEEFLLSNKISLNPLFFVKFALVKLVDFMDLQFSDRIICVSKKMIEYLHTRKNIPFEKMAYVTNGVDLKFFKPMSDEIVEQKRRELGLEDKFVFGYIGYFQKWQGVENFIEAARRINDKKLHFLIVGGERKLKENGITLIPKIPRSQTPLYYSMCDVLVLPRPSHPATEIAAPTKFAEYTAMGKPILATDVGDAANFVRDYKCGIVVKNNSIENLVKGIIEFKNKSEEEIKRMGKNSRALAENEFDWEKVGKNLLKAINI